MRRHLAKGGGWLAGAGGLTALTYLATTEATGGRHPAWPYLLFVAMVLGGLGLYFACQEPTKVEADPVKGPAEPAPEHDQAPEHEQAPETWPWDLEFDQPAEPEQATQIPHRPAFTERWHFTSDGFEATPLMNMVSTAMPGYMMSQDQPPFARIGVCVACDPISSDASSSQIGARFLEFLSRGPVAELLSELTGVGGEITWTRLAGNGALRLEAVLGDPNDARPVASAMLLPPVTGMRLYGRADGIACLWLHVEAHAPDGSPPPPAGLHDWHKRLHLAVSLAAPFAQFLVNDVGVATRDEPTARVGVMLQTRGPMSDLVDPGELRVLPGASQSNQYLGYAIADRAGKPAHDVARDMLKSMCDHTMHLSDFDSELAAL
jgi:hypothetical protein